MNTIWERFPSGSEAGVFFPLEYKMESSVYRAQSDR